MVLLTTQIDIAASPAQVRNIFLDFSSYPEWSKTFLKSIELCSGDKENIKPGDKLKVVLPGMTFSPTVRANTVEEFKWLGSLFGVFSGEHAFRFQPSGTTPGHTTLVHEETFTGILSFLLGPTWSEGKKTKAGFERFNVELKERAEQLRS